MTRFFPDSGTPELVNGAIVKQSASALLTAFPRTNGTGSITLAGAVATNDVVQITFAAAFLAASIVVSVTAAAGDSLATLTEKLVAAIEANTSLQAYGVFATNAGAVLHVNWPGPLANLVTMTPHTNTGAETYTTVQLTGGSGPLLADPTRISNDYFRIVYNGAPLKFTAGEPINTTDPGLIAALVAAKAPII